MKTIGMIGGMSCESTVTYYEILNRETVRALGGLHSSKILMYNVDFAEIEERMSRDDWAAVADRMADISLRLEKAGADFIVIATNTIHKVVPDLETRIGIPVLHIADAAADAVKAKGMRKVGLLGTKYTMTQDFIRDRLTAAGLEVIVPEEKDIGIVNDVIFNELCVGSILDPSRREFQRIISAMKDRGAEGVILGCTEIGMLIKEEDSVLPVFDTTVIHAQAAARRALEG